MKNGKTEQILANIVVPEEEITVIKLYLNHKKLLIADNKGSLRTFLLPNGAQYC